MTPTTIRIGVPPARRAAVENFLKREALSWTVVDSPGGDVAVVEAAPKAECAAGTLHPGGRIPCATALALADSCGVPGKTIGRLLNLLEIKVRDCQLGCFP